MDEKGLPERLKLLRRIKGLTQTEASKLIDIGYSTLQMHETRGGPGNQAIKKYADFYGCTTDWIITGKGQPFADDQDGAADAFIPVDKPKLSPNEGGVMDDFDMIPMACAKLNAGGGNVVLSEGFREFYAFRKDWISRIATGKNRVFLMAVEGDSMEPTIYDGDTVMIDQGRKEIRTGRVYALGTGDLIMIKRLDVLMDARVKVISDNGKYSPYIIDGKSLRVIGQVVWFARQLVRPE